jgi:hypothetical protein
VSRFNKGKLPSDTEDSEDDKRMLRSTREEKVGEFLQGTYQGTQSSYYPVARFSLTLTHGPWPFSHTRTLLFIQVAAATMTVAAAVVDTAEAAVVDTAETVTRFED